MSSTIFPHHHPRTYKVKVIIPSTFRHIVMVCLCFEPSHPRLLGHVVMLSIDFDMLIVSQIVKIIANLNPCVRGAGAGSRQVRPEICRPGSQLGNDRDP